MTAMNRKYEAGRRVAKSLLANENALDNTILATATTIIETVRAREAFQAGLAANQDPIVALMKQGLRLAEARAEAAAAHASLVRIRADEGMEELEFGCQRPCLLDGEQPSAALKVA